MKITVTPLKVCSPIERHIVNERLTNLYNDFKRKSEEKKKKPVERIYVPAAKKNNMARTVNHLFYEIGYMRGRCEYDEPGIIRYRSYIPGNMNDLVFHGIGDAKNWLVGAGIWKEKQ